MLMVNMNACIIATESIGVCIFYTIGILGVKSFVRTMVGLRMPIIRIAVFYQVVQLSYLVIGISTITQIDTPAKLVDTFEFIGRERNRIEMSLLPGNISLSSSNRKGRASFESFERCCMNADPVGVC